MVKIQSHGFFFYKLHILKPNSMATKLLTTHFNNYLRLIKKEATISIPINTTQQIKCKVTITRQVLVGKAALTRYIFCRKRN